MQYDTINSLLDRYWDGDTTLEEERQIRAYFASGQVDERLRSVAPLFAAIRAEQQIKTNVANEAWERTSTAPALHISYLRMGLAAASIALVLGWTWWQWTAQPVNDTGVVATAPPVVPPTVAPILEAAPQVADVQSAPRPKKTTKAPKTAPNVLQDTREAVVEAPVPTALESDTYGTPEEALAELRAALSLVSRKMNKGKEEALKHMDEVQQADVF
jgi:hypothetical protein